MKLHYQFLILFMDGITSSKNNSNYSIYTKYWIFLIINKIISLIKKFEKKSKNYAFSSS